MYSPYEIDGRPLRVLFFGNDDNYNFRMATWSREMGVDADLWIIQPPDPKRGDVRLLNPNARDLTWVKDVPIADCRKFALRPGDIGRQIDTDYDFVFTSGPCSLMGSLRLRRPRGLLAIGAEIGDLPFPFRPGYALSQGKRPMRYNISVAFLVRAALSRTDFIVDCFEAHTDRLRRLGLLEKRLFKGLANDCARDRSLIRDDLRQDLLRRYGAARRVFLWFSRLNFSDPNALIYKGVERYLKALETVLPELKAGTVRLVMGRHGNEVDAFMRLVQASPAGPFIDWVDHLGTPELMTYLSLPNAVLFAEFGEILREFSGISRDAASIGTVTVSSGQPEFIRRAYGKEAPVLRAVSAAEIAARMRELVSMPIDEFGSLQAAMREYGETAVDYHAHMQIYYEHVQEALARRARRNQG